MMVFRHERGSNCGEIFVLDEKTAGFSARLVLL